MSDTRRSPRGFTLTELVVVIVVATVLAAFAISHIDTKDFDTEGFANQTAAMVRYAQRLAIAQRRTVVVVASASQIKLCYTDSTCALHVREPPGTGDFSKGVPSGISVSSGTISFDALGKSAGGTITVGGKSITVENETGYVRYTP